MREVVQAQRVFANIAAGELRGLKLGIDELHARVERREIDEEFLQRGAARVEHRAIIFRARLEHPMFAEPFQESPRTNLQSLAGRTDEFIGDVVGIGLIAHKDVYIQIGLCADLVPLCWRHMS